MTDSHGELLWVKQQRRRSELPVRGTGEVPSAAEFTQVRKLAQGNEAAWFGEERAKF